MYERASENRISVILALPIPSRDKWLEYTLEKYRYWLKNFTVEKNLPLVDFSTAIMLPDNTPNPEYFSDEVHPSEKGYRIMANCFCAFIEEYFKEFEGF